MNVDIRIKLSALWVARMLVGFLGDVLRFFQPGMLEAIIAGDVDGMQISEGFLLTVAIIFVLPICMVPLTLTLPYKASRWANIILALIISAIDLIGLATYTYAYASLLIIVGLIFTARIVWDGWKWREVES